MARRISVPVSRPTSQVLAGIEWTENYNCFNATVGGWLELSFHWNMTRGDGNYVISVAGRQLKGRGASPEEAAKIATAAARLWLNRAKDELDKAADVKAPEQE